MAVTAETPGSHPRIPARERARPGPLLVSDPPRWAPALLIALSLTPATLCLGESTPTPAKVAPEPLSLIVLTLDTTRADHLGAYGAAGAMTPVLDSLAAGGARYARAITPSPLTLPAHASLFTGLDPPEHGVRNNGTAVLPAELPTLAATLAARGYATGAFVASRVLDHRFGLDRGFDFYDDRMAAEQLGQYGYPERDAHAVTSAALAWLDSLPAGKPYFLWLHYYDPHAPYQPPRSPGLSQQHGVADASQGYAGEIAFVDRQIGRLLAALPVGERLVAAVGDHGEMLGEHGETGHGIFLYRAALEVPLILAGPGIPVGLVIEETVATRRMASTLLRLLGADGGGAPLPGPVLPGLGEESPRQPVYSEARMPASAYGWAALKAVTDGPWRLIAAPRPELYNVVDDPGEQRNLLATGRPGAAGSRQAKAPARRLRAVLVAIDAGFERRLGTEPAHDPELQANLRSLGYLSNMSEAGTIDPKDGIRLLADFDRARQLMGAGNTVQALGLLQGLVARNPRNVPFRSRLAAAQLETGDTRAALASYRAAIELDPRLDFLHRNLADAYLRLGHIEQARAEYRLALELNPRFAAAWLRLAELAARAGEGAQERRLLLEAVAAGTTSAAILSRLGQIEITAGAADAAEAHLRQATGLAPAWALPWLLRGQAAEARGDADAAAEHYRKAAALAPGSKEGREARRRLSEQ